MYVFVYVCMLYVCEFGGGLDFTYVGWVEVKRVGTGLSIGVGMCGCRYGGRCGYGDRCGFR